VRPTLEAYVRRFGEAAPVEGISGLKAAGDTVTLTLLRPCEGALAALCIPVAGTAGAWTALEQDAQHMLLENAAGERLELRVSSDPAADLLAGTVTEARLETPDQSLLTALEEAGFRRTPLEPDSLGWVGVSAAHYPDVTARRAILALLDRGPAVDYWPAGTAEAAYSPACGWVTAGETSTAHDPAGAKELFRQAGYRFKSDGMTDPRGERARFVFSLPGEEHPARAVFEGAAQLLRTWGAEAEIRVETDLVALVNRGEAAVWALAWDCAGDPGYLAERYDPAGHRAAARALGLHLLADSAGGRALADSVAEARQQMEPEARREAWQRAFADLEQLAVCKPLYRRGAVWVCK